MTQSTNKLGLQFPCAISFDYRNFERIDTPLELARTIYGYDHQGIWFDPTTGRLTQIPHQGKPLGYFASTADTEDAALLEFLASCDWERIRAYCGDNCTLWDADSLRASIHDCETIEGEPADHLRHALEILQ